MPVNGKAVAALTAGGIFLYSGVRGYSVLKALQNVIQGRNPGESQTGASLNTTASNTGSGNTPVSGSGSARSILQQTAAQFGWTGAEWSALDWIENAEAGYNTKARNSSSGALGMAQALGHGNANTGGTLGNEYGGYGLTDAQARQANSGDAAMQSLWMCNYIKDDYGDPLRAKAFHQANGWY